MTPIVVGATQQTHEDDEPTIVTSTTVSTGDDEQVLWHSHSDELPVVRYNLGDLWLPPMLVVAMRTGQPLVITDPVSERLLTSVDRVQDIFCSWYPDDMRRVEVTAPAAEREPLSSRLGRRLGRPAPGTGSCFSGGADSFYTLVKNDAQIDYLVFAFGLDVPLHKTDTVERVGRELTGIAEESGKELLLARSNVRRFIGRRASWGLHSHGAALASLGALFSPMISTLLIPASHTYAVPFPWGSHPLLDGLWSSERLETVHDGAEKSRAEKVAAIADDLTTRRHVRVCVKAWEQDLNCGECGKCMRTMIALELQGKLQHVETFPDRVDLDKLSELRGVMPADVFQFEDVLAMAKATPGRDDLVAVLDDILDEYYGRVAGPRPSYFPT